MDLNKIATFLGGELKAQSILCYGSYAQMTHDDKSDIDLLVLTKATIPSSQDRRDAYIKIPDCKILKIDEGKVKHGGDMEWDNSWSPINDRIEIEGKVVEIGYNTVSWVECVINNLIGRHKITFKEFPFRPYTFLGLVESSTVLYDNEGFIQKVKLQIQPMPQGLKNEIIKTFLPVLIESHEELKDYADRNIGILAYQFHLFRGVDAAIQLLFVINDVYDPASKRTEGFLFNLKKKPAGLETFLNHVMPRFFEKKKETTQFFEEMIDFVKQKYKHETHKIT